MRFTSLLGFALVTAGVACAPKNEVFISTKDAFNPPRLPVQQGVTVTWVNDDTVAHTVIGTTDPETWDSGTLDPGGRFDHLFNSAGTFAYICPRHGERGTVVVQ
ncbi:MAG: cupredoxin domain-containing protein [Gemmatimonadales bacterium]